MPVKVILTLACEDDYFDFIDNGGLKCIDLAKSPYPAILLEIQVGNEKPKRISKLGSAAARPTSPELEVLLSDYDVSDYIVKLLSHPRVLNENGQWEDRQDLRIETLGDFLFTPTNVLLSFYGIKKRRLNYILRQIEHHRRINQAAIDDSTNHFE